MLEIFNNLKPFLEDNYRKIHVRAYAKLRKISPPTASKILSDYRKEGLLNRETENRYQYYSANRNNMVFKQLCRTYWQLRLEKAGLIRHIQENTVLPVMIMFGSASKAEMHPKSDIDLALFTPTAKKYDLKKFEKKLRHEIQLLVLEDRETVKNKQLLNNILNGHKILGAW